MLAKEAQEETQSNERERELEREQLLARHFYPGFVVGYLKSDFDKLYKDATKEKSR